MPFPSLGELPNPGIKPLSPAGGLAGGFFTTEPTEHPNILFIYMAVSGLICSMWDRILRPGIEPRPPGLGAQSLSHWTTREILKITLAI